MYEKPQYLTNQGYRRMDKNPYKDKAAVQLKALQVKPKTASAPLTRTQLAAPGRGISPQAAKLIAGALSIMLKQK